MAAGDGLVQGSWAAKESVNGKAVYQCQVTVSTAETDAQTLPIKLRPDKPFTLFVSSSATPDGQALPLKLWYGFSSSFAVTGQGTSVVATDGAFWKQLSDDVVLAVTTTQHAFLLDPDLPVADVVTVAAIATGLKVRIPKGISYYAFHLDGGSTLAAVTTTFTVVQ